MHSNMNMLKHLDDLLLNSIDEILRNIFDGNSKELIHQHMMRTDSIEWNEIPQHLQIFTSTLSSLFGSTHVLINELILETVYHKLGFVFESKKGCTFLDYMKELRIKWRRLDP